MYPTISHLLNDLLGTNLTLPIATFGFFVAIAFLVGGWILSNELKRKEQEGLLQSIKRKVLIGEGITKIEILTSGIGGFIAGFKLIHAFTNYEDLVHNPQEFILSTQGNFIGGIAIAALSIYTKWMEKSKDKLESPKLKEQIIHPYQLTSNMIFIAAISGILGAIIFANLEQGKLFGFNGLTFYGGFILATASLIYYANKNQLKIIHLMDAAAPAVMISYGIGRIGCHMSGDGDWGIVNNNPKPDWMSFLPDWMWSYNYPHNVLTDDPLNGRVINGEMTAIDDCAGTFWDPYCYELTNPVYPTPIYEVIMASLIFLFLWNIRKRIKISGVLFFIYLTLNGIERFLIEKIRVNEKYDFLGGITQAEIISFSLILIGLLGCFLLVRNNQKIKSQQ